MLSPSLAIVLLVVLMGAVTVAGLGWVIVRGWIARDAIEQQARAVFEDDDLRALRPWETDAQRHARVAEHGPLEPARPGAFGGAR